MADNYLEKRMDDLRSGRLTASGNTQKRSGSSSKSGHLAIPFPERRVMIVGSAERLAGAIAVAFRRARCKTALFDNDKIAGERLAHDHGIRFHNADTCNREELKNAMSNLLDAWHDIDIAIFIKNDDESGEETLQTIREVIHQWRMKLPFPNPYGGRLIIISPNFPDETDKNEVKLQSHGFTSNNIIIKETENPPIDSLSRLCLFLCAPGNEYISGAVIPVYDIINQ